MPNALYNILVGAYFTISFAVSICIHPRARKTNTYIKYSLGRAPTKFAYNYAAGEFLGY